MGKNCAIILAAGKGKRMGASKNKQFLEINGRPILVYALQAFEQNKNISEIILVSAKEELKYCADEIVSRYGIKKVLKIVEGGIERQESVLNGLQAIDNCNIVLIHDGARPFVDQKTIDDGIRYAEIYGAAACGVKPKDTIKYRDSKGFSAGTLDRNLLYHVQTPQCFQHDFILDFHRKLVKEKVLVTDDTAVVERYHKKVYLYEGSYNNIKITTPEDLIIGEKILNLIKEKM